MLRSARFRQQFSRPSWGEGFLFVFSLNGSRTVGATSLCITTAGIVSAQVALPRFLRWRAQPPCA